MNQSAATRSPCRHRSRRFGARYVGVLAALAVVAGRPLRSEATISFTPSGFVGDVVASGLPFATGIAFAPDGRLFITLKSGVVRVYQNGTLLPTPFIDISAQVSDSNDRGLLGITFHPDFPNTPYVYLLFTWNPPGYSNIAIGGRVSRLIRVEADPAQGYNVAKPGSDQPQTTPGGPGHVILLGKNSTLANIGNPLDGRDSHASCMTGLTMAGTPIEDCIPSDEDSHSIGTVMFGNDGSLFAGSGDGSNYINVDPRALRAQNVNSLAGKIMRIDPATGNGLPDNPFYDATCPQCNRSKVYAYGLRNPFRFTVHPVTNEVYIGDVGWNTWEEIDIGKGQNFGWPCYEGGAAGTPPPVESGLTTSLQQGSYATSSGTSAACNALYAQGLGAVRAPIFSYSHDGTDGAGSTGGASANGGTFYRGTVYPPAYQNALFILDYSRRWIRYLTFDTQGRATVHNFGKETADGMVQVLPGPDTNLYVVVLSETGSQIRRIRYIGGGNTPPTAVANATPTIGTVPLTVTFSSQGSFDPDGQALSYSWAFGDGGTSTQQNPTHTYTAAGVYTATLTLTELTSPFATRTANVVITVGNEPPLAHITAPADGTTYQIGDVITYSGNATSGGQPLDPSQLSWELRLHHNQHIHFNLLPGGSGGTFTVIQHGDNTYYELCLTATVDQTLTDTQCVNLLPRTTPITLTTDPIGLLVNYENEGLTQASPMIINPVVGSQDTVSVQAIQGGRTFVGWTDGVTTTGHDFLVGTTPATYTAQYVNRPPVAVAAANPLSGVVPLAVAFTGSGSHDPEFATLTYSWDFGDGNASAQADPVHTYAAAGTYIATLTVTDQLNGTASQPVTVTVTPPGALCGNGQLDAGEACDGGACCTAGCQFAGAGAVCRPAAGSCDVAETCSGSSAACPSDGFAPNGTSCSDGNVCNGAETCQGGTCTPGTALVCNDGNVCTTDTCNPTTGCVFTNNTAPCDDGVACTSDVCSNGLCVGTSTCTGGQTCNVTTGLCETPGALPSPWQQQDIGAVGVAGSGSFDGATGTFTEKGSGADIDGQSDSFHYIYQSMTGDGELIARVTSITNTDPWAKAGVMIRETLTPTSKHAMMVLTPGNGAAFQWRPATNGWNQHISGGAATAPLWVRIQRAGNVFRGYRSADGVTWTQIGTDTFTMNQTVLVGLALTSHNNPVLGTATFTNVSLVGGGAPTTTTTTVAPTTTTTTTIATPTTTTSTTTSPTPTTSTSTTTSTTSATPTTTTSTTTTPAPTTTTSTTTTTIAPGALPSPWQQQDIGTVGVTGGGTFDGATGTFTVKGSGADIDGQSDAFHYVYQSMTGDGELIARITSQTNTDPWAKAGVMIRETLTATSKHAMMVLTPGNGAVFQRRTTTNGWNQSTSGGAATAPLWVRIQRAGNVFRGYRSPDGVTWTQVGTDTFTMNTTVFVGLALTSHNNPVLGTATFTNVTFTGSGAPTTTTTTTVAPPTTTTTVPGALGITTTALPGGRLGTAYTATLTASGGTPPYTWSIASGALPAGLTLAASTGVISGTPTTLGTANFTVRVTAGAQSATRPLSIAIAQNAVVAENALPGNPASQWDVSGAGDPSIQGFARDISVDQGGTISFKIDTNSTNYRLDIYRLGYYAGLGARLVATVQPSASLPQTQPACLSDPTTGLVDCGNWAVSASWTVPPTATSGIYIAKLVREDPEDGRASHIPFIVRDDDGHSDLLFQTTDTTWQAYNSYGGNSLYNGLPVGRAYKVSYNRPFTTRCCDFPNGSTATWLFNTEYPMLRWLERNGYDVSYTTGVDADRRGAEMLEHRVYMPVGHDEYWTAAQRGNVEAARAAGVHLAVFSANTVFWKTRWEPSIDGSGTPYRTLVCYKETHANAKIDPLPNVWTGTWRDPRFSPPADGGRPENALTGTIFTVNGPRNDAMTVPAADGKMRFWRNTSVASLSAGQVATLPTGVLGSEWDEDLDNGSRPPGVVRMSTTTVSAVQYLQDYGTNYADGTATHHLTLYLHASRALVFSAGTIQWPWGLDATHDFPGTPSDARMQQATVNLFADMGVQPTTLQAGLLLATASTDTTPPSAAITGPAGGATVTIGTQVTITGTAADVGGQVGGVEVSTDGGTTWHPANGRASWSYVWTPSVLGSATLRARAVDDSANLGAASQGVAVTVAPSTLTSIAVTPANSTKTVGGSQQFTATGTYSDASAKDLTSQVTWVSSNTGVASVTASGLATAVATGTTTISATLGTVSGSTGLTVVSGALTITTTALPAGNVGVGYSATLAATGGTPPYTWSIVSGSLPAGLSLTPNTGVISGTPTAAGASSFTVQVTTGAQSATKALSVTVNAVTATIWPTNPVPAVVDGGDPGAVELGVKFRSDVAGFITGLRFYKSAGNTGTHVGHLWSSSGTPLATVTFTGETASGWQQANFASPVANAANTTYVASYFAPNGHYSGNANYFATQGVDSPPLHALANGVSGGNGVYAYGATSTFPTNTYLAQNYWVDVVFSTTSP